MLKPGTLVDITGGEDYHDFSFSVPAVVIREHASLVEVRQDDVTGYVKPRHVRRIKRGDPRHPGHAQNRTTR